MFWTCAGYRSDLTFKSLSRNDLIGWWLTVNCQSRQIMQGWNLTDCWAALVVEDHGVAVLPGNVNRHQGQSHGEAFAEKKCHHRCSQPAIPHSLPTTDLLSAAAARSRWSVVGPPEILGIRSWEPETLRLQTRGGMIIAKQSNFCCRENLNDHFDFLEHICNRFWGFWESRSQSTPNCKWRSRLKHQTWKNCFHRGFYWLLNFNGWLISISPLHQNQLWVVEVQKHSVFPGHGLEAPMNKFLFKRHWNLVFEGNSDLLKMLSFLRTIIIKASSCTLSTVFIQFHCQATLYSCKRPFGEIL